MADPRLANFNTCCRLCLTDSADNIKSIFGDGIANRGLQQKIAASLGVEISLNDKFSTMVCSSCIDKVEAWQSYKTTCFENQTKLEQWIQTVADPELSIIIKEEPVDGNNSPAVVVVNGECRVKHEMVDEEFNDLPPPLTPQAPEELDNAANETVRKECSVCNKQFSTIGNRKKHEKLFHSIKTGSTTESDIGSLSQDDRSQSSINSQALIEIDKEPSTEEQKILFAAGLKLLQRNSTPPIFQENLSTIEHSYTEKCKAMVTMHKTLRCECHNVGYPQLKILLAHLRSMKIWFPPFTCFNCMITFGDRSSNAKHFARCPSSKIATLIKLSNLKKRSEVKTRLYQNYRCTKCRSMYSFHEDYCAHVDEEHTDIIMPYTCRCKRVFQSLDDYKDHAYVSCLVEFYCDICFMTVKTVDAFTKHAISVHDNSEGFVMLQEDNYRPRSVNYKSPPERPHRVGVKREHTDVSNIISGKRRSSYKPPVLDLEPETEEEEEREKVINPVNIQRLPGLVCPICKNKYSNNNNMYRHYKLHFTPTSSLAVDREPIKETKEEKVRPTETPQTKSYDDSLYCCPDCGGMFSSGEWEKHKGMHKKKTCKECGKVFQFQSELDQHRSVHLNIKVYRDSKTDVYKSTMVGTNGESSMVVVCEVCNHMFTSKEQLKEHKLTHETAQMPVLESAVDKNKKFKCTLCNKEYVAYTSLWSHNKRNHPKNKTEKDFPKKCTYCDKMLFTGGAFFMHLQMHERTIHGTAQKPHLKPEININAIREIKEVREKKDSGDDDESYHTCKRCFKVFSTRSNLKNHMKSHGINISPNTKSTKKSLKKVWCNVCHSAFENSTQLARHKLEDHNVDGMPTLSDEQSESDVKAPFVFTCDICVQTFSTKSGLKKHKEKHSREIKPVLKKKPSLVYCKYCKISFNNAAELSNHMKDEHLEAVKERKKEKEKSKDYHCKPCNKSFNSYFALCAHQGWHKRSNKIQTVGDDSVNVKKELAEFQCKSCGAVLVNNTSLQIHILEKHRNINAIPLSRCTMCNLDFSSQEEYEQHKKFHTVAEKPSSKKNFPCNFCPAGFSRIDTLKTHVRQFHKLQAQAPQEYKCFHCNRVFDKQNSLAIHLKVHEKHRLTTGPKPAFSCSICNMGFDVPKDLRAHTIQAHPF